MDTNNVFAQTPEEELVYQEINDCPYIFYKGDSIEVKWIVRGKLNKETFSNTNFKKLEVKTCEEIKSSIKKENGVMVTGIL